jgi:mono/diheme cytochrome c family protein
MRTPLGSTARRSRLATLAALSLAVATLVSVACQGGDRADRTADTAFAPIVDSTQRNPDSTVTIPHANTPVDTATVQRDTAPLLLVAVDSAIGDSLYQNSRGRCLSCHGPRGSGNASLGPNLRDSVWVDSDGSVAGITSVIHDGVAVPKAGSARMPAFGNQLDSTSVHRLAVYVYSLSHPGAVARDSAAARAALPVMPSGAPADTSVR